MASEITHIVYGKKIFDRNPGFNWEEFVIGTIYPDIRYVAKIDRNLTHVYNTSEENIPKTSSFEAGKYVHCLVDEKRESFIRSKGIYDFLPQKTVTTAALKIYEDKIVYDLFPDWGNLSVNLGKILPEEVNYDLTIEIVSRWHKFFQKYVLKPPDISIWKELAIMLGHDEQIQNELFDMIEVIEKNPQVINIIKDTYDII